MKNRVDITYPIIIKTITGNSYEFKSSFVSVSQSNTIYPIKPDIAEINNFPIKVNTLPKACNIPNFIGFENNNIKAFIQLVQKF